LTELTETICRTYTNLNVLKGMSYSDFMPFIRKMYEKNSEDRRWLLYCSVFPNYNKKTFVPFDKFQAQMQPKNKTTSPTIKKTTKEDQKDVLEGVKRMMACKL